LNFPIFQGYYMMAELCVCVCVCVCSAFIIFPFHFHRRIFFLSLLYVFIQFIFHFHIFIYIYLPTIVHIYMYICFHLNRSLRKPTFSPFIRFIINFFFSAQPNSKDDWICQSLQSRKSVRLNLALRRFFNI